MSLGAAELASLARPGKPALIVAQLQQVAREHRAMADRYPQTRPQETRNGEDAGEH